MSSLAAAVRDVVSGDCGREAQEDDALREAWTRPPYFSVHRARLVDFPGLIYEGLAPR